jgi:uncharacterized glyoxalase superfamily protein PhnB
MRLKEERMLANRSMPSGTVIPVLGYEDVGVAVTWLCEAFGFTERWRAGNHRAQLSVGGGGAIAIAEHRAEPSAERDLSHSVMVRVEDAGAHYQRAQQFGALILEPPTDYPYGERQYTAADLAGRRWTFSQSIADVAPEQWGGKSNRLE